ncbi:MAG: HD-GYP domain-containing protein [Acidobacteriota bacterium]
MNTFENDDEDLTMDPILVVDDEPAIRESLAEFLTGEGYECEVAATGFEALIKLNSRPMALVIADIRMPDLDGLKLLDNLAQNNPEIAVMMITGVADLQTAVETMKKGAVDYITKPFTLDRVLESVHGAMRQSRQRSENKRIAQNLGTVLSKKSVALSSALRDLDEHRDMTLELLVKALDAREHETHNHSVRVQAYTLRLAQQFDFDEARIVDLARGALLHDIGKIGVSDAILLKPGKLTLEEKAEIFKHPLIGYEMFQGVRFLDKAARMVLYHHERFDGAGYPEGLKGEEIPLESRMFAVLDTYDAMTSDRPYRKKLPVEVAREEIRRVSGSQLDPAVVEEFFKVPQQDWDEIGRRHS